MVSSDYFPNVSGVATLTHEQAAGLAALGHDVRILTSKAGQAGDEQATGVSVARIDSPSRSIARVLTLKRELRREGLSWKPDFIWCTTYRAFGVPTMQTARRMRIPYGIYFHGTELLTENRILRRSILCRVAGLAQIVATNSRNSQRLLSEFYGITAEVITPGVNEASSVDSESRATIRRFWLSELQADIAEGDAIIFICACRLVRAKGIDIAVEAISRLPESLRARCIFVIAGEGPETHFLKQISQNVGLGKQIYFAGAVDRMELPSYLAAADCYLQPSQPKDGFLESFGISYLEAQASGLPCIATRFGGIPEAIRDGDTGILAEPGSVSGVVEAMIQIMSSPEVRRKAGYAAKDWAMANLWTEHLRKLNALIAGKLND